MFSSKVVLGRRLELRVWRRVKATFQIHFCQNLINSWHKLSSLLHLPWTSVSIWTVFLPQEEAFLWHCEPILIAGLNLCYRARQPAWPEEPLTFIFMNSNITTQLTKHNLVRHVCTHRHFAERVPIACRLFPGICLNAGNWIHSIIHAKSQYVKKMSELALNFKQKGPFKWIQLFEDVCQPLLCRTQSCSWFIRNKWKREILWKLALFIYQ